MDLKRVALSCYSGSLQTAKRFSEEALKRKGEVDESKVALYIRKCLKALPNVLKMKDRMRSAEDALMYSTIFQNYIRVSIAWPRKTW